MGLKSFLFGGSESLQSKRAKSYVDMLQGVQKNIFETQGPELERIIKEGRGYGEGIANMQLEARKRALQEQARQQALQSQRGIARLGMAGRSSLGLLANQIGQQNVGNQFAQAQAALPLQRAMLGEQLYQQRLGNVLGTIGQGMQYGELPGIKFGKSGGLFGGIKKLAGTFAGSLAKSGGEKLGASIFS